MLLAFAMGWRSRVMVEAAIPDMPTTAVQVSLAKALAEDGWPVGDVARARKGAGLVRTLAEAMEYSHQLGIVHRDLKPANILLQITDCRLQNGNCPPNADAANKSEILNLQSAIR